MSGNTYCANVPHRTLVWGIKTCWSVCLSGGGGGGNLKKSMSCTHVKILTIMDRPTELCSRKQFIWKVGILEQSDSCYAVNY